MLGPVAQLHLGNLFLYSNEMLSHEFSGPLRIINGYGNINFFMFVKSFRKTLWFCETVASCSSNCIFHPTDKNFHQVK